QEVALAPAVVEVAGEQVGVVRRADFEVEALVPGGGVRGEAGEVRARALRGEQRERVVAPLEAGRVVEEPVAGAAAGGEFAGRGDGFDEREDAVLGRDAAPHAALGLELDGRLDRRGSAAGRAREQRPGEEERADPGTSCHGALSDARRARTSTLCRADSATH